MQRPPSSAQMLKRCRRNLCSRRFANAFPSVRRCLSEISTLKHQCSFFLVELNGMHFEVRMRKATSTIDSGEALLSRVCAMMT